VDEVVYDEGHFNEQLRDNLGLLKTPRTNAGLISEINGLTFVNLSGLNLTGDIVPVASVNVFTAENNYGTGRIVLPVGVDAGLDGGPGSLWVEGDYLHWNDNVNVEWRYLGTLVAAGSPGLSGSFWVEGNDAHYIDEDGDERKAIGTSSGFHSDAAALGGSLWMEAYLHWIKQTGTTEYNGHADSHSDSAHTDTHSDTAHTDTHNDAAHSDAAHSDTAHVDVSHSDFHSDNHTDEIGPHIDIHNDTHGDTAHSDISHNDGAHADVSHGDSHNDVAHVDSHTDAGHSDSHGDAPELA